MPPPSTTFNAEGQPGFGTTVPVLGGSGQSRANADATDSWMASESVG